MSTEEPMVIEDLVRTATRAGATLVRDIRPLTEPERDRLRRRPAPGTRRRLSWGVPLAAATAVVLVALGLVAVRHLGAPVPGPSGPARPTSVPRYYVALDQEQLFSVGPAGSSGRAGPAALIVGDDATGKAIATVNPPRGLQFEGVQGAADDRTFVVMAAGKTGLPPYTWYLLRIAPGTAHPAELAKLPIKLPGSVVDVRVYVPSPDGRDVAIESLNKPPRSAATGTTLAVYSLSSGAELRAWTANEDITEGLAEDTLSWLSDGRQLVFSDQDLTETSGPNVQNKLRTIDLSGSGRDLLADSRALLTVISPRSNPATCFMMEAAPDGQTAVCGTQYNILTVGGTSAGCARGGLAFTAYSVRTGKPVGVLYRYRGACQFGYTKVLWVGASARDSIVAMEFEVASHGRTQVGLLGVVGNGRLRLLPMAKTVPATAYVNVAF